MNKTILYTIGHSNQSINEFIQLLEAYNINCIIDVRSTPYSKYTPQFNESFIKMQLNKRRILYASFGRYFGARRFDCLKIEEFIKKGRKETKQQVNFEIGITTSDFTIGVNRLQNAISQGRIVALMCSELDPLSCHRFSFISRFFYDMGWDIEHIARNESGQGVVYSHQFLEHKMISDYISHKKLKVTSDQVMGLFNDNYSTEQQRIDAYRVKNREIGWILDDEKDSDTENEQKYNSI